MLYENRRLCIGHHLLVIPHVIRNSFPCHVELPKNLFKIIIILHIVKNLNSNNQ